MTVEKKFIKIIVADDDPNIRRALQIVLQNEGYTVHCYDTAIAAFQQICAQDYDLALLDIKMGEVSGIDLFQKMMKNGISIPVIFISGNASLSEAFQAVKMGAFDFVEKPFSSDRIAITVFRCLEHEGLKRKIQAIKTEDSKTTLIGESKATHKIRAEIRKVSNTQATVLILGESGTGKELIAKMIHEQSDRKNRPFVRVNCSAIPETLIESELFGFEKGAFTGAILAKKGYFEQASYGTLFLDEIGDMSLNAQAKVLRAIQNAEIQKLGSERVIPVNVRIIAATNKNLKDEVSNGTFREDLFYRLSVIPIESLPLRERPEDIPVLATWFLKEYCEKNGLKEKTLGSEVLTQLKNYSWPGNIRELQNLVERLVIMSGEVVRSTDLPKYFFEKESFQVHTQKGLSLKEFKEQSEREYIISILKEHNGNISKTSEILKIERTHLHKKIAQYGIQKREYFI